MPAHVRAALRTIRRAEEPLLASPARWFPWANSRVDRPDECESGGKNHWLIGSFVKSRRRIGARHLWWPCGSDARGGRTVAPRPSGRCVGRTRFEAHLMDLKRQRPQGWFM